MWLRCVGAFFGRANEEDVESTSAAVMMEVVVEHLGFFFDQANEDDVESTAVMVVDAEQKKLIG